MIIREGDNQVEIEVVDRVAANLPTPGDVELSIEVQSNGFVGHGFAWVDAPTLTTFLQQLKELEKTRRSSAEMEGMSPGTFHFRVWSIDRRGHIAISGMVAKDVHNGEVGPYRHSVEFGFEIDPTSLPRLLADFAHVVESPQIEK